MKAADYTERVERPNAERWARSILRVSRSTNDPKTLADWARIANVSVSSLRTMCYLAHTSPKQSLTMARLLRAVTLAQSAGCLPQDLLDIRDPRTLKNMLRKAGAREADCKPFTPLMLCDRQTIITTETPLNVLRTLMVIEGVGE